MYDAKWGGKIMRLSICIITKNESEKLKKCLQALRPYELEIVVVDTGSIDNTRQIALEYTSSVYDFSWCDDFAAAKNYAVQKAKNDMVMVVDSDEYLQELNIDELWKTVISHPKEVGRIRRINAFVRNAETNRIKEWVNRIFDRRLYHYQGRIHEQIVRGSVFENRKTNQVCEEASYQTYLTNVLLEHEGYDGSEEERKQKAMRNIKLLEIEYKQNPEDIYILYQLGKGWYMAGEYDKAIYFFEIALGYDVNPKLEYVIDLVETYGYALLNANRPNVAILLESVYDEFGNSADFQFLMGLIYMNNALFERAVEEFLKATNHKEAKAEGVNSYLGFYNAGVIKECLGDVKAAKEFYEKCGDYQKAKERISALGIV